jgi:hypothetical protein
MTGAGELGARAGDAEQSQIGADGVSQSSSRRQPPGPSDRPKGPGSGLRLVTGQGRRHVLDGMHFSGW